MSEFPDLKKVFSSEYIGELDLPKPATVEISAVTYETADLGSVKDQRLIIAFKGAKKRLVVNKTNAKRIVRLHGHKTAEWIGKSITIYFDPSVKFGRQTVGGVRVQEK